MHTPALAVVLAAALLLSACGFTPSPPPRPQDTPRVAINRVDPRQVDVNTQLPPAPEPLTITAAPAPVSNPPGEPAGPAVIASTAAIPVPEAPPKVEPITNAPPSTDTVERPAPIMVADSVVQGEKAQPTLPESVADSSASQATELAAKAEPTAVEPIVLKEIWKIGPEDGTVRQALARWAAKAGWTFGPDQWEVNFDLPIQAPAEFDAESFKEATQALSQAVAMTETPIRPCFYGNRVLRVIPFTRSCNRSPATQS